MTDRLFKSMEFNVEAFAKNEETKNKLLKLYGEKWTAILEEKFHQKHFLKYYNSKSIRS